jgi:PAS domain S-box-containing protein
VRKGEVWGNERWHRMFGFPGSGTVPLDDVLARIEPADRPGVRAAVDRSLAGGAEYRGDFRVALPDGTGRWLSVRGRPQTAEGGAQRMLGASIDITERRHAEESARTLSRRLIQTQEQEHARVARDLHDDVTQRLARLAIDASRVERAVPDGEPRDTARGLQAGLVRLCEDVHTLSYQLHPSIVDDLGLVEALRVECERWSCHGPEPAQLRLRDLPPVIPTDTALCLYRVAQEALRNAARHAGGHGVSVDLAGADGGLQLVVQDAGPGFDPKAEGRQPTLGLASMRERVSLLGGELAVDSAPGEGATVLAWVPLAGGPS